MHLQTIAGWKNWTENKWGYATGMSPFLDYILEDKSKYSKLKDTINPKNKQYWIDRDNDFLIGNSGGILMNIDFVFVGVDVFSRTADHFEKYGVYTTHPVGSPEYKSFWKTEMSRRMKGVSAKCKLYIEDIPLYLSAKTDEERKAILRPLRITGDHYNYLNFGRIERAPNEKERAVLDSQGKQKIKTVEGFPRFWDGDYWNFKVDELIADNGYNLAKAKARRKGFSFKRGSQAANTLNANKNVTVALVADQITYLTDAGATSQMAKTNLDFYENNTYWKRGYLSENFDKGIELGYRKTKEGNKKFGFRSKLLSFAIGKNESAAVGTKAVDMDFEEAGKCPNLQKAINVMMSNMESGGTQIGTFRVYGTAGTKGANWAAFSDMFYHPERNEMIHFENIWDIKSRHTTCGFFFPNIWCYEPHMEDGNSLLFDAWLDDSERKARAKKNLSGDDLIIFVGQRANMPSEAFVNTKENMFNTLELSEFKNILKIDTNLHFYNDGWYVLENGDVRFMSKAECIEKNIFKTGSFHPYITDVPHNKNTDVHGCIREFYSPIRGSENDYLIVYDPYAVNKTKEAITNKHSLASIQVWTRLGNKLGLPPKRLMATWTGRLDRTEDADKVALMFCLRWGGKLLVENNRGDCIANFKKWGFKRLLLRDPRDYMATSEKEKWSDVYGMTIGDSDTKYDGLQMIYDFIFEIVNRNEDGIIKYGFENILDISLIEEFLTFTLDGNYDRISAMILAMYQFRADSYKLKEKLSDLAQRDNNNSSKRKFNRMLI